MTVKPGHRQVNLHLSPDDYALLDWLARRAGVAATTKAREILLDVLREDAAAHRDPAAPARSEG